MLGNLLEEQRDLRHRAWMKDYINPSPEPLPPFPPLKTCKRHLCHLSLEPTPAYQFISLNET